MSTIYERVEGEPAIQELTERFYRKILMDDRVSGFFDDVDMDRQIAKQKAFLTMVTGGPNNYTGKDMREAHKHLIARGLNDTHVDVVIEHLTGSLKELEVPSDIIETVRSVCESARDDVLNR